MVQVSRHVTGQWHQRVDARLGNPLQGNQEPLLVKNNDGRHSGTVEVSKSVKRGTFSLQCSDTVGWAVGRASGHVKSWLLVCWW